MRCDAAQWDETRCDGAGRVAAKEERRLIKSIKGWSNTSRAAVEGELAKSLTNASGTFWLLQSSANYDGIAKEAPDNFIECLDRSRF